MAFANIRRPVSLDLRKLKMTYLDKSIFHPLFDDKQGEITALDFEFDCNDCRNAWIVRYQRYFVDIQTYHCSNGNKFLDPNNFENC